MKIEDIVDRYYQVVFSHCLSILMNRERAEDACHDVFLKVQMNIDMLDSGRNISAWLLTTTRNHCYDIYRKERHSFSMENLADILKDNSINPEERLLEKERLTTIVQGLKSLKPVYREVLVLRDIEGISYKDIGRHLRIESKKVKWMLFKARKKLRIFIEDYHERE